MYRLILLCAFSMLSLVRCGDAVALNPADLDSAFGANGTALTPSQIPQGSPIFASAHAVAQTSDGKLLVAGVCSFIGTGDGCVVRYGIDGVVDATFGQGGIATVSAKPTEYRASPVALILRDTGKFVVVGECSATFTYPFGAWCLTQFLPDGIVDAAFGVGGVARLQPSDLGYGQLRRSVMQSDGKILVVGGCPDAASSTVQLSSRFCILRYLTDGHLDSAFGKQGLVSTLSGDAFDTIGAIDVQPEGKILVAAACHPPSAEPTVFCLFRYQADGSVDNTFGNGGRLLTSVETVDQTIQMVVHSDGSVVLAGYCVLNSLCLVRYSNNGTLDSNFGLAGLSVVKFKSFFQSRALRVTAEGKYLVAGECLTDNTYLGSCVDRLLANGKLDASFGVGGKADIHITGVQDRPNDLLVQRDGKYVVVGVCSTPTPNHSTYSNRICLVRLRGDATATAIAPNKTMAEFRYLPLDYYFITSRNSEKALLDGLASTGWERTGQTFAVQTEKAAANVAISRFFFDKVAIGKSRGSHFYTAIESEKAALRALNPSNSTSPTLPFDEGEDSYAFLPPIEGIGGSCANNLVPVFRVFRGSARFPDNPNHRFVTDPALYRQLVSQGWDDEGVKLCVLRL